MNLISLFCGCGGLDLGFQQAGFRIDWANDNTSSIEETYIANHPDTTLRIGDIKRIPSVEIPDNAVGLIGGPPCQSWSSAGKGLGINDKRGKLFYEYIRVLQDKQPLFFVAENVKGLMSKTHQGSLTKIVEMFNEAGYEVTIALMNSADYNVPQNRERLVIVGYRRDLGITFEFPRPNANRPTVRQYLEDITENPASCVANRAQLNLERPNHEYFLSDYTYIFMSRNRVLNWDSQSYTIQASGRQASLHPQAPPMRAVAKDVMEFHPEYLHLYRRLSIRECARIQTFPDNFIFHYNHLNSGYKMIGNAVPVNLARAIAEKIFNDIHPIWLQIENVRQQNIAMQV